jgi:hypothetical protein
MKRLHPRANRLGLPPAILAFWLAILAMTLASVLYTCVATYGLHLDYPYGEPLFYADERWFDFTIYFTRFHHFRTPAFWDAYEYPFTYPAPLAVLYGLLYKIPHVLRFYLIAYAAVAVALWLMLRRAMVKRGAQNVIAIAFTATLFATNYPLRTLFESANTEGVTALLAAAGVWLVLRNRTWPGAALIGIAGSMKIFPFILLALLLSKRRYREFVFGLATAAIVTIASLAYIGPSIAEAQSHIDQGIRYVKYTFIFAVNPAGVTFNHSLFTLVKFAVIALGRQLHPQTIQDHADWVLRAARERALLEVTFNVYVVAAAAFGFLAYFVWMRRLPLLNQLLALTSCALFLPPLSADYTLIHLLLPFSLLCLYAQDMRRRRFDVPGLTAACLCFAPIFAFQTYITWRYRFSCEVRTLGLIALLLVVLRHRFEWPFLDSADLTAGDSPNQSPSPAPARV